MKKNIIIENVGVCMDGGTLILEIKKNQSTFYEVQFVQKVIFSSRALREQLPGSLVLNEKEVEIRSELEKEILSEIKSAEFGTKISEKERGSLKQIISEHIDFVESEDYIKVAKKVGRIK
ncbi:hypothetical protein NJT12_16705 [Flavobacterium sp. AC]|uniref:Uncharacterized protein n=1 Tax=Flavobacterium azizsancarii TaxID=2961580 RepID=A0ABT4WGP4_9FLAO|nr:hypothetical protein [Flavobacterium azizsancarii]MDA6071260.1 hypothetical protein [Flavobacterium azizsancarii]